ncbi:hypothetical protein GCM10007973_17410 [Polymorphobacter multimanifer]|uniref:S8 family serine peptidase n=1 Tax=Polymorphobacter multimanifer TaxID=1070431 RepID=UPI0016675923|nr:S8 family serine peptidase [Polymorphobacter multimanifer]GGI81443.1 hypothetical protein GCM10007973_17410 [Polymorphobacter multimanifer]
MARKPTRDDGGDSGLGALGADVDAMLLAALERAEAEGGGTGEEISATDETLTTGRMIVTYKEGAADDGALANMGMRTADARDFEDGAVAMDALGDADALLLPEIGVAVISGNAASERSLGSAGAKSLASDSPISVIEPEYFAFSEGDAGEYLRGFLRAAQTIEADLRGLGAPVDEEDEEGGALVLGATPGLIASRVPQSSRSGLGIRVAVLDTGMDLGHPEFAGRAMVSRSFVGQPVQDLHSHGTHCIGTACGPLAPPGNTPRYGIAHRSTIFVGKVLSNSGTGSTGGILAGMNWAIANNGAVISMSLGAQTGVQFGYVAAGAAALARGCLIIAAAGNAASSTGAPANSPSIMSVASLDRNLAPSSFSNRGKIDISAIGRDVWSSVPRPQRHGFKTGTSMACPHVAGVAALWAQTNGSLRGMALWQRLLASARPLPYPASRVGRGLVQAP